MDSNMLTWTSTRDWLRYADLGRIQRTIRSMILFAFNDYNIVSYTLARPTL